jgi:transcription antitermination factor NusG
MEKINTSQIYQWHVVYIRSRAEKKAELELQNKNIETYLPLQRKLRQWSDRKKWVEMPLISGYLFVRISRKEYDQVLQVNHVVSYVRFEGKAAIIPESQIESLKLMLKQDNLEISVTQENFEVGQKIEVVSGPLIGLQGKLVKIKGKNKVAVVLEKLGYSAVIEISTENLRVFESVESESEF